MELDELLVQEGVAVAPERIRRVLLEAEAMGRHPVVALVEEGLIVEDVLAEVLARASGTVVVDLEQPAETGAAQLISRALAQERLVLPIAKNSGGGRLRVAFANPLDAAARELVEEATRARVQPLVGTLSGIRRAIERAFATRTTRVVSGRTEIPPEITRRVELQASPGTHPLHRLEEEATIEQRHEALLLALIERGLLTRADYMEALKRLLPGRRED